MMKWILKAKWAVFIAWLVVTIALVIIAPNLGDLVRDKGQINVPDGYSSTQAEALISSMSNDESGGQSTALVFHDEQGFTDEQLSEVELTLRALQEQGEQLGIVSVHTHFDTPELAEQMYSADNRTVLALLYVDIGDRTPDEARNDLYAALESSSVEHYLTGNWIIVEDVIQSSESGLKKTEFITVGFILFILFIVFRSAAAPFVPLLTVGISYLVSQSIVAYLAHYWDFPLSNFTQIFMVAILFGIGTDYCILLISRFKEEYAEKQQIEAAVIATYRTAGKTVLFSSAAVLVGFTSIGFSTFILYRSAVAVAVGIAVMLIAIYTLVPFFLAVLGKGLFWPVKGNIEHKQSALWGRVGTFSLTKPMRAVLILVVIIAPLLVSQKGLISFSSLDEIGDKYDSVKGFNIIAESFGPGEAMPTTVVVKTTQPLDNPEGLSLIELTTRELLKVEGVNKVRSATRPVGDILEDFLVADQVELLEQGIEDGNEGLVQIGSGLSEASQALSDNAPQLLEAADGAQQLAEGTRGIQSGVTELSAGLAQLTAGVKEGTVGADQLAAGLQQAKNSAIELAAANQTLLKGYQTATSGLSDLSGGYQAIATEQTKLAAGLLGVEQGLQGLAAAHPDLQSDELYQQLVGTVSQLSQGASALGSQVEQLNNALGSIQGGLTQANDGYQQAIAGQTALGDGLQQFIDGLHQLSSGLKQVSNGQDTIVQKLPSMDEGLEQLASAQGELQTGFTNIEDQLAELTNGLDQSVDGLEQVREGFSSATAYLQGLTNSPDKQLTGWYIPKEAIESDEFQEALDNYMSTDRQVTTFDIVFSSNPYSHEAMEQIDSLSNVVRTVFDDTTYSDAEVYVGGVTSINHDLNVISDEDYNRTMLLMLVGIFLVLLILFRSIVIPIYIVVSLLITFYTSLAITELIYVQLFGLSGVSWAVPFFGFVILLALGVDYSIFLMDRFKENRHMGSHEALLEAMKSMGSVIISAAIILGGTFAAMLPSGVMSLLQIATLVLCGLFLYAVVMLPLFIPVMVKLFGKYNWWPFMKKE